MKRINIIVLMALVTLIAGCSVFEEPLPPQEGIAQVRVNIGSPARTILPDFDWAFSKYELSVEPAGDNEQNAPLPEERSGDNDWVTMSVPHGEWIITVTAYVGVAGTDYPVAKGSALLDVWGNTYVNVVLNMPESGGTGTFSLTATYPAGASAQVKLEPWPSGSAVINNASVPVSQNVPSGIYFLTVTATANGKTITRNEIVHIYRGLTTNANYIFTKLDFGNDPLRIGGTVNVLLDGKSPDNAWIHIYRSDRLDIEIASGEIIFTYSDGNGTWSAEIDNLRGADTLYFQLNVAGIFWTETIGSIPVPLENITGIDLGSVSFDFDSFDPVPIDPDEWVDGIVPFDAWYIDDWYSIEVTADTSYNFWMNNVDEGDGTQLAEASMTAFYSNGEQIFSTDQSWDEPETFTAERSGTIYLVVYARGDRDSIVTYAIAYSTSDTRP